MYVEILKISPLGFVLFKNFKKDSLVSHVPEKLLPKPNFIFITPQANHIPLSRNWLLFPYLIFFILAPRYPSR
jgi:hypothetical protein